MNWAAGPREGGLGQGVPGGAFTRPQAGAYEANRRMAAALPVVIAARPSSRDGPRAVPVIPSADSAAAAAEAALATETSEASAAAAAGAVSAEAEASADLAAEAVEVALAEAGAAVSAAVAAEAASAADAETILNDQQIEKVPFAIDRCS